MAASVHQMLAFHVRSDGIYLENARFRIKGASYFGMETDICVPHGLWGGDASTTLEEIARFLRAHTFNLVRIPLAMDAVLENRRVDRYKMGNERDFIDRFAPDELRYLDVLDYVVDTFARHDLLVLLDAHVLVAGGPITPLWYDEQRRDETKEWLSKTWGILATRYKYAWNVIGADLNNEPHGIASWGNGQENTDWRLAALKVSTQILHTCPHWLVLVEGVQNSTASAPDLPCFWGENLQDVRHCPLELTVAERLVYSPHVYGPDVSDQPYFHHPQFPRNLPHVWDTHFGYVHKRYGTVLVGEWGGKYRDPRDQIWQQEFVAYLKTCDVDFIYWCVNPNSGDTEGLLEHDWKTPRADKLSLLAAFSGSSIPKQQ
ncbi:Cellulase-8, endo-1,4-beta-glucanase, partial [Globisporangium splendens]